MKTTKLKIIKKDGTIEDFQDQKIKNAVLKSANRAMVELSDQDLDNIVSMVKEVITSKDITEVDIATMHYAVENALENINPAIAKSYKDYRNYKQDFVHMMDEVYEKSQSIRFIGDKENANTDSALVATKRCLIFNELNKRLYRRFFMTKDELQACKIGYIYVHDQSARLDSFNCCLADVGNIMHGGFEMGNIWYNEPKSLDVAFDVMGDIILSTASQQYGGFTVPEVDTILIPYAEKSYKHYYAEYISIKLGDEEVDEIPWELENAAVAFAMSKVEREFEQGFQGIEMKLNTVGSSRGDYPFITMTFGLSTNVFGKMASKAFLKVHMNGQGKTGYKKPVLFPKLVFLYDENLHDVGCINEDVFDAGVECSSKTMYPDWLSLTGDGYVASMYKKYGKVVSPMGCVQKDELVTYKLYGNLYVESIGRMWNRLRCIYAQKLQQEGQPHLYMDIDPNVVQIYDKENGFVGTKRMVKNKSNNWARVTFSNGRILECTTDHPLPVIGKGRTFVKDLEIGDIVPINKNQYVEESFDEFTPEFAWALGVIICDGCYDEHATVSVGLDEGIIATYLEPIMKDRYDADMRVVERHRGKKGDYLDIKFNSTGMIGADLRYIFGGLQKSERQIPEYIFRSNKNVRLAFLAGMIDADGYINNINHISTIQLGSTNKELALQQMALMQSLGIRASVYPNHYDGSDYSKIRYRVEGEAIHDILQYIKCDKKKDNFKDTERVNFSSSDLDEASVTRIEIFEHRIDWSYDVTTESDHFDVSGIYSHNCRAFLSPWYERGGIHPADENDTPVFIGRFNIGVVSLHLPMILAKSRQENKDFYEVLDYYLEMIRNIHKRTFDYLGEMRASINPIMFCEGGAYNGHLNPQDKIKPLLKPMTASFGITALNELQELYNGKSIREDGQFALEVMQHINNKINEFKEADEILYAIYGTPAENLTGLQVEQFRKMYGIIENVSDHPYVSNSFHCHVSEDISPIEKQDSEGRFWDMFNGGKIQYVRYPIPYNIEAIKTLIKRAMKLGFYEGVNLSLAYCDDCGHQELEMDVCPKCGSRNLTKIDRMNGYLAYSRVHGDTRLNSAKMAEIADRKSM